MIMAENIHPSPPNNPPAFFFFFPCVFMWQTFLELWRLPLGWGGEAEGALIHEPCYRGCKSWEQRKWDRSGAAGETEMLLASLSSWANFEQSPTTDLCKQSEEHPQELFQQSGNQHEEGPLSGPSKPQLHRQGGSKAQDPSTLFVSGLLESNAALTRDDYSTGLGANMAAQCLLSNSCLPQVPSKSFLPGAVWSVPLLSLLIA